MQGKAQMEAGKCKKPSTRFVASCSTKKIPISPIFENFSKLLQNPGHSTVALFGNSTMSRVVFIAEYIWPYIGNYGQRHRLHEN